MTTTLSSPELAPEARTERFRPSTPGVLLRAALVSATLLFVVFYPPQDDVLVPFAVTAAIYAIVGLSLNVIIGYTGQLSLGHQGFVGIGAFAAAYSLTEQGVPFAMTFVIAGVISGAFALLIGLVALRITGLYLSLITLVFGLTLEDSLFEVEEFTNAGAGQPAERPEWLFDDGNLYWFCLAFLAGALYLDWRLLRSKVGRALLAIKENERVASAFGVNVTGYKLLAFTFSGVLAGVAGALLAYRDGSVIGTNFGFSTQLFLIFVLMVVVGGAGSRLGVIIGSAIFALLDYLLEETWLHSVVDEVFGLFGTAGEDAAQFAPLFTGALLLVLTLVFKPGGIAEQIRPLTRWLGGGPFVVHGVTETGPAAVEGSSVRA